MYIEAYAVPDWHLFGGTLLVGGGARGGGWDHLVSRWICMLNPHDHRGGRVYAGQYCTRTHTSALAASKSATSLASTGLLRSAQSEMVTEAIWSQIIQEGS